MAASAVERKRSDEAPRVAGLVVGVDVGGTFTDCLMLDPATGAFSVAKVPSTPQDQSIGFMSGLRALRCDLSRAQTVVHGRAARARNFSDSPANSKH
jgi:hypothetical protein